MAKKASEKPGKQVAKAGKSSSGVPAHLSNYKPQGLGVSTDVHDNVIPMARILQKQSPEVEKKNGAYVQGADAGDIYIKNLDKPIIKGDDGFLFQPVHYYWGFVEWIVRAKGGGGGSGFVAFYKPQDKPTDTHMAPDPNNPERQIEVRKNGNMLVETRYHSGFLIPEDDSASIGLVLPFSGSGHSVSKTWMGMMNRKIINGAKADSWACYYRLKSLYKTKGTNSWYLFEVSDAGEDEDGNPETMWAPSIEDIQRGHELYMALESGSKKVDESQTDTSGAEPSGGKASGKL